MDKLLIVDDEVDVREFAANFFRKRKFDVVTAGSGEEAIEVADKIKPKLILLDINMNGMTGIETLAKIREKEIGALVVMVTGKKPEENGTLKRCEELGISGYIHKPLQLHELEEAVLSLLNK